MNTPRQGRGAFTIVELMVVIGVLALLMGLLLPALSAAQRKSQKSHELHSLRQVGIAWQMYSTSAKEQVLPGFLEPAVQEQWNVNYQFANHARVPPAPTYSSGPNVAGPWTFRLLPLLGYDHETVHGYDDHSDFDAQNIGDPQIDIGLEHTIETAFQPGFGYNALYVGGWWEIDPDRGIPSPRYFDADANVVSRSVASIRRSSQLVIFCSSSWLVPGIYRKWPADQEGSHYVNPPWLEADQQWTAAGASSGPSIGSIAQAGSTLTRGSGDPTSLQVETETAAPIGRYTRLAATLYADIHQAVNTPGALLDMRNWIDAADKPDFRHQRQ